MDYKNKRGRSRRMNRKRGEAEMNDRELLECIAQKVTEMDTKIDSLGAKMEKIESKLTAVSEQTADLVEFKIEIISRFDSIAESQKSLFEMYGEHEAEIRNLRRRPV